MLSIEVRDILKSVREQERILLATKTRLESRNIKCSESAVYQHERSKMIGMLDILDILEINRKEFNWIF